MKNKWKKCVDYCVVAIAAGEADPNVTLLKNLAKQQGLSDKDKAWLCLLYSTCYCTSTAWFLYNTLPKLQDLKLDKLQDFWDNIGKKLVFQSDRKYVKNMNWFVPIIKSYRKSIGVDHEKILEAIKSGSQDDIFKLITSLKYCGRFSAFLFIDCAQQLFDIQILINPKNWNEWATAGEGLCHAIDREDWVEQHHKSDTYPAEAKKVLDESFEKMKQDVSEAAGIEVNDSDLETALCAYRKLFKQSRYLGYYIDRQQEEFIRNTTVFEENDKLELMRQLWKARKKFLDNDYLGELQGWTGLRKELNKVFMETGGKSFG